MCDGKLGKVTSFGDPSLNIECSVRKTSRRVLGRAGRGTKNGVKKALCRLRVSFVCLSEPFIDASGQRMVVLYQPEKALRRPEIILCWPKKSVCWPESALFRSRQTLLWLERILCRC